MQRHMSHPVHTAFLNPKAIGIILLVIAILLSVTVARPYLADPANHKETLAIIHESKGNATALTLSVTLASTAITLLPEDIGSPIADELSELSTPLLVIVCILFFEEYLLTAMEALVFNILVPAGCAFIIASLLLQRGSIRVIGYKILLIALVCAAVIPLSAGLTGLIQDTYAEKLNGIAVRMDEISVTFNEMLNAKDITKFLSSLASGVSAILDLAKEALSLLIDGVAILLITSCVIPLLTAILFIWALKSIIAGHMENLEDTAMSVIKRIPRRRTPPAPEAPDEDDAQIPA